MDGLSHTATVHLVCGLNGAGKTTYARKLAESYPAVRFSLDEWMIRLHPEIPFNAEGYSALAEACKGLIWDVAVQCLDFGVDVILDWNQWSRSRRAAWRDKAKSAGHDVLLHFIDVPVETAIERSAARAESGEPYSHSVMANDVTHLAQIFERPSPDEHIVVRVITE